MNNQYRIRGVVDAIQMKYENFEAIKEFARVYDNAFLFSEADNTKMLTLRLPIGRMAYPMDYIIKDHDGTVFPVPAFIFEAMFSRVEEND